MYGFNKDNLSYRLKVLGFEKRSPVFYWSDNNYIIRQKTIVKSGKNNKATKRWEVCKFGEILFFDEFLSVIEIKLLTEFRYLLSDKVLKELEENERSNKI